MRRGATIRQRLGDLLLLLSLVALIWSVAGLLTGGFVLHVAGVPVTTRNPLRPVAVAVALAAAAVWALGREQASSRLAPLVGTRARRPIHVAVMAAVGAFALAAAWSTRAAGGSDSSCYVLQADAFAHGHASLPPVLSEIPPGIAPAALAPIGFIASPAPPHEAVPICASGLALMMAPFLAVGRDLVFLIVPVFAGLLMWWTFAFGRRISDAATAACATILVGCSPIVLYQAVQPMSDVPAAALFMGALVFAGRAGRGDAFVAGLLASLAVLTRPNLAVVVAPLVLLLFENRSRFLWFTAALMPAGIAMLVLNAVRYGGPLASGYGDSGVLFASAHVAPNLARYPRWLIETQSPLLLLALAGPAMLWARGLGRVALVTTLSISALFATYCAYSVFDDWWYIRFLLPAVPVLIVFMTLVLFAIATRLSPAHGRAGAMIACALLASWYLDVAERRHAMNLRTLEARFRVAGEYSGRALPGNAIVLAVQHSGSVRFYGGKPTLAWDGIDPAALDNVVAWLRARGFMPFIVLEDAEEQRFRERFGTQRVGQLDWPPATEIHARVRVRIYDPSQRDRYLGGQRFETQHVR